METRQKLEAKYNALIDRYDATYTVPAKFNISHGMNLILFGITILGFSLIMHLGSSLEFLILALLIFATTIAISGIFAFKFVQPLLIRIEYKGKERHIFSRNITLQKLLITSVIAFVVGVFPILSDYFGLTVESTMYIFLKLVSVWLGCVAGIQECMLEHARNVWIANRDRKSKTDDEAQESTQSQQSGKQ